MNSFGQTSRTAPKLGIIGGSGLCSFPELKQLGVIRPYVTKYGAMSDEIIISDYCGRRVSFIPRHGRQHTLPPHKVPYMANLIALRDLGVEFVLATCIVGSLRKDIPPGSIVIPDQFVNLTWGRDDTYKGGGKFLHLPMGAPYCSKMRELIKVAAEMTNQKVIPKGTVAVIQGPRFSTQAESIWLSDNGWDLVNMTQYPECYFARELGLCYGTIAAVTDYDVGLKEDLTINPENMESILEVFRTNVSVTKSLLTAFVEQCYERLDCGCAQAAIKPYYEK